jgi:hypothetical protein
LTGFSNFQDHLGRSPKEFKQIEIPHPERNKWQQRTFYLLCDKSLPHINKQRIRRIKKVSAAPSRISIHSVPEAEANTKISGLKKINNCVGE